MNVPEGRCPFDVFHPNCPSRIIFEKIFSRWGMLVLARLTVSPLRFGELREAVGGISDRMLTQTLQVLESNGLAHREALGGKPPRVEYSLTPKGIRLGKTLEAMVDQLYRELEEGGA